MQDKKKLWWVAGLDQARIYEPCGGLVALTGVKKPKPRLNSCARKSNRKQVFRTMAAALKCFVARVAAKGFPAARGARGGDT